MILFAALLAFSRFFIGVHYLSDIFAGIGLAILCPGIATAIINWVIKSKIFDLQRLDQAIKACIVLTFVIGPILFYFT